MKKSIKKIVLWTINTVFFVIVVFLGINQAGLGAEISDLENELLFYSEKKQELSENVLLGSSAEITSKKTEELGFRKPEEVIYIDSVDSFASLLTR